LGLWGLELLRKMLSRCLISCCFVVFSVMGTMVRPLQSLS
jgi:hypothetical protein